jgi:hypothetical protein
LGATLGGWVVLRAAVLWPTIDTPRDLVRMFAPPAAAAARGAPPPRTAAVLPAPLASAILLPRMRFRLAVTPATGTATTRAEVLATLAPVRNSRSEAPVHGDGAITPPLRPTPTAADRRLSGSAWGIVRRGVASGFPGGQLGGSQAGLRMAYALGASRRVAVTVRVSSPIGGAGSEAAAGVEYRLARLPLRIIAEQRLSLDGGSGGQALYAVGGTAPVPMAAGFRLEGYAQGGVVLRRGVQGFADGAARLTRAISDGLDIGGGVWGGVQPDVARVDVGPTIGYVLPVPRHRLRLSVDWRQRIAGRARPGSGPALSIGTDF